MSRTSAENPGRGLPPLGDPALSAAYSWAAALAGDRAILDVGCGNGRGAALLAAAGARSVDGVDESPETVLEAERSHGGRASFRAAAITALPFDDDTFQLVVCVRTRVDPTEAEAALGELRRVLIPGGVLLTSATVGGAFGVGAADARRLEEVLRLRFRRVAAYGHHLSRASLIAPEPPGETERRVSREPADWPRAQSTLLLASDGALPTLPAAVSLLEEPSLEVRPDPESTAAWEERARGAEAEAAATRWEVMTSREASQALLERLVELEDRPVRRLSRLIVRTRDARRRRRARRKVRMLRSLVRAVRRWRER